ncbi:hypothetical protein GCM10027019_23150 [Melaminivora jejuensis]|uniref:glycosyltransferase n=2 Tax=Melaminivora jejuensis TaxID=1267217 RepID=UPI001E61DC4B|nr:glycosyltransferase [Melaminivora jejuensis]UHJ64532.1 glycosyltransferase [Melaminivora jejuensis]
MHISEADITPYQASPVPAARAVLVFAPHPDDEIFGCGGALALHVRAGHPVHVVLLTDGGHQEGHQESDQQGEEQPGAGADYAATRLQESRQAAQLLGLAPPVCWGLADRSVHYDEALVQRMLDTVAELQADVIYAPSPWELHPDHRATCLAALETVRRLGAAGTADTAVGGGAPTLYLYEVSAPLRPNRLVDISPVWQAKQAAMQAFASQEANLPYASFIGALNRFRALTLHPAAAQAEAFECVSAQQLHSGGRLLIENERERLLARGVAVLPQDAPLVSVIVRSMGRPTLAQTLSSIALQTYSHLEIVLVDAAGDGLPGADLQGLSVPVQRVSTGQRLPRAEAANAGLRAARGEYLIFLDDDDWFYPDHIAKLVLASRRSPAFRAMHTAIECVDETGQPQGEIFDFPYAEGELRYGNFLPIHSVLFQRALLDEGCAFDPAFDLYEDWDFWLQVEQRTPFGFVPGVSAAYRIQAGSGEGVQTDPQRSRNATAQLYAKWQVLQAPQTFSELIGRAVERRALLRQLGRSGREQQELLQQLNKQQRAALDAQQAADQARQDAHQLRQAHDQACAGRDESLQDLRRAWAEQAATKAAWAEEHVQREKAQSLSAALQEELRLTREHANNLQASLTRTQQALDTTHLQNGGLQQEMSALLASRSWRWTKPMRQAIRGARAVRTARNRGMGFRALASRTLQVWRNEGLAGVRLRVQRILQPAAHRPAGLGASGGTAAAPVPSSRDYAAWVVAHDTLGAEELALLQRQYEQLSARPLISIIMPVYGPQDDDLLRAIASVRAQVYPHWELCICDDTSPDERTRELLRAQAAEEPRIRLAFHEHNQHISAASNTAIALAQGDWIAFLDQDDELRPHTLLSVAQALQQHPQARVLYSDEDKIDGQGRRFDPYFKPDFNLGLLRSHNYMCHFAVYQHALMRELGGLRKGFEGAQDYDMVLRAIDAVPREAVIHIPRILYHWRTAVGSTASGHGNKSYAFKAGQRALREHLQRRGLSGDIIEAAEAPGMYRVTWQRPQPAPLVSIVIPTRNGHAILRQCLDSLRQTAYPHYEVIVVDNGSDEPATLELLAERSRSGQIRVQRDDSPFNFSALNNRAVQQAARGEFVLLMNNDIEITHPEWLDEMVGPAMEPGVGCVGARLWYPDGRVQHAGVIMVCGVAGHGHKLLHRGQHGYMGRAVLAQDFVAVTAACLLVRRSIYDEVGGLDESLAVAFNDVDFCLKVHQAGYRNHWTPYAELIHHESVTRGYEDTPEKQQRFKGEIDTLQSRWAALIARDPCYSPNLTAHAEDFSLAWPPSVNLEQLGAQ